MTTWAVEFGSPDSAYWDSGDVRPTPLSGLTRSQLLRADVRLLPVDPLSKKPLSCNEHSVCRAFRRGFNSATRNLDLLVAVEALHPDINLGAVPGPTLVGVDMDLYKKEGRASWQRILEAGRLDADHVVVDTPSDGKHLWIQRTSADDLRSLPGVDVRTNGNGYLLVPGSVVRDRFTGEVGTYALSNGTWGDFQTDHGIEDLLRRRETESSRSRPTITVQRTLISTDTATERLLQGWETLGSEYVGTGSEADQSTWNGPQWMVNRAGSDTSESANLCALWAKAYWSGATPEQAVEALLVYRPFLAGSRLDRSREWLLEDAQRVFHKAALPSKVMSRRRQIFWTRVIDTVRGRLREVLEYAVELANVAQSEFVYLGTQAVAAQFGVTVSLAARWLKQLVHRGLIVVEQEYIFIREGDPRNRCRLFSIKGLTTGTSTASKPTPVISKLNLPVSPPVNPLVGHVRDLTEQGLTNAQISEKLDITVRRVQQLRAQGREMEQIEQAEVADEPVGDAQVTSEPVDREAPGSISGHKELAEEPGETSPPAQNGTNIETRLSSVGRKVLDLFLGPDRRGQHVPDHEDDSIFEGIEFSQMLPKRRQWDH